MLYKRSLLLFLISFCFISLLPASQTLYDRNSEEYNQTRLLCQRAGVVGPSSATPVNANELVLALDRIDCNLLPEYLKERYDELYKKILKRKLQKSTRNLMQRINIQDKVFPVFLSKFMSQYLKYDYFI